MPGIPIPDYDDPKEIYAYFGLAAFAANLLESSLINWTVALRLGNLSGTKRQDFETAFGHFEKRTLGQLLRATRELTAVPTDLDSVLTKALSERNRLIHHFFREHAVNATHPAGQKVIIGELSSMIKTFDHADALITPIYLSIWEHFGVNETIIQQELAELLRETEAKNSGI